jgi:hypothetical protein
MSARSALHGGDGVVLHPIDLVAHHGDTEAGNVFLAHGGLGADVVPRAAQSLRCGT